MQRARTSLRRSAWLLASLVVPFVALVFLHLVPGLDVSNTSVHFHLVVVSGIAACALAVAVVASVAAIRVHQSGTLLLASGCLSCGTFMLVHGLVTPGVGHTRYNLWVSRSSALALSSFALFQCASTFATGTRGARFLARHPAWFLAAVAGGLAWFALTVVPDPHRLHGLYGFPHELGLWSIASLVSVIALLPTAVEHWRRFRLGRDALQAVLAFAATMSVGAVMSARYGKLWHLSWWNYHVYLLAAFFAVVCTILRKYTRARTVSSALGSAFAVDPIEHITCNHPDALRALVTAVEVKDAYTHGHSRRTANLAATLGVRLRLAPEDLRLLAQGAYLHDVGKIAVPDAVLNKPGRLTDEERALIETHSEIGADMVCRAPSLSECAAIVRHHHERYDGTGYPDRKRADEIPLLARITAVADVWDALTSDRVYRKGWDPSDALAHIVAARDTHFDPVVVDAFVDLAAEWGYRVAPAQGDAAEVAAALHDCHDALVSRAPELTEV